MSWLQRRPQVSNPTNFVSVGLNKTVLVVGLGNPGNEYAKNRHNIGFKCVDNLVRSLDEFGNWVNKKSLKCIESSGQLGDKRVIVVKPDTFMNNSGEAVALAANFYKVDPGSIIVIHDELDIDFGQVRTRVGGSDAGHNGIKSISGSLDYENYGRVRIGIGPKKPAQIDSKDFVLQDFNKKEQEQLTHLYKEVNAILTEYIYGNSPMRAETRTFII